MDADCDESRVKAAFLGSLSAVGEEPMPLYSVRSMIREPGPEVRFSHPVVAKQFPWITAVKLEPEIRRADDSAVLDRVFGPNLVVFLARYLRILGSIRANASVFERVWAEYEEDQRRAEVPFRFQALLTLKGQFDNLVFSPTVRIKAIKDEWRAERLELDSSGIDFRALSMDLMMCEYMLEIEVDLPRGSWGALNTPEYIADHVVTALRLSAPGGVGWYRSWLEATVPVFIQPFHGTTGKSGGDRQVRPPMAWEGDLAVLRALFAAVQKGASDSRLDLALRRFESSYHKREPEDRLVDYWIALETLLLPDQKTELSHLGPLRIALQLESTLQARKTLFQRMRASYDARSGIVHGDLGRKARADLPSLESETEMALRLVLQRAVLAGCAPSKAQLQELELKADN